MLSLATVTHISSMFKRGEEWSNQYLIVTAGLFLIPTFGITHSYIDDYRTKKRKAALNSERRESSERRLDVVERRLTSKVRETIFSLRALDVAHSAIHWRRWAGNQVEERNAEAADSAEVTTASEGGGEAAANIVETPPTPHDAAASGTSPPIQDLHDLGVATNVEAALTAKAQPNASEMIAALQAPAVNERATTGRHRLPTVRYRRSQSNA